MAVTWVVTWHRLIGPAGVKLVDLKLLKRAKVWGFKVKGLKGEGREGSELEGQGSGFRVQGSGFRG
eukprot:1191631-Rhodomonas_salina.1